MNVAVWFDSAPACFLVCRRRSPWFPRHSRRCAGQPIDPWIKRALSFIRFAQRWWNCTHLLQHQGHLCNMQWLPTIRALNARHAVTRPEQERVGGRHIKTPGRAAPGAAAADRETHCRLKPPPLQPAPPLRRHSLLAAVAAAASTASAPRRCRWGGRGVICRALAFKPQHLTGDCHRLANWDSRFLVSTLLLVGLVERIDCKDSDS